MKSAIAACAVVVLALAGCSSSHPATAPQVEPSSAAPIATSATVAPKTSPLVSDAPTSTAPSTGIGAREPDVGYDADAFITLDQAVINFAATPGSYADAPTQGAYLIAHVTFESTAGSFDANPTFFEAQTANGDAYQIAVVPAKAPELNLEQVQEGHKVAGWLTFDLPAPTGAATPYDVTFQDPQGLQLEWDFTCGKSGQCT